MRRDRVDILVLGDILSYGLLIKTKRGVE